MSPKGQRPGLRDLLEILTSVAQEFTGVWLFFDALDECQEQQRATLLSSIAQLKNANIKIFATSRPHPEDIRQTFEKAIQLEVSANQADIETFVRSKLVPKRLKPAFIGEIISKILTQAEGMCVHN